MCRFRNIVEVYIGSYQTSMMKFFLAKIEAKICQPAASQVYDEALNKSLQCYCQVFSFKNGVFQN